MCRSQRYDPWFQYAKRYAATKYSRLSSHLRTPGTSYCRSGATTERCLCGMCMNFAISQFRNDGVNAVRWHRLENHMCAPTHALGKLTLRPARLDRLLVSPYHQCAKPLQQQKRGTTMALSCATAACSSHHSRMHSRRGSHTRHTCTKQGGHRAPLLGHIHLYQAFLSWARRSAVA